MNRNLFIRLILLAAAAVICVVVLAYANLIISEMQREELKRVNIWADATRLLAQDEPSENDVLLMLLGIVQDNTSIPVLVTDADDNVLFFRNLTSRDSLLTSDDVERHFARLKSSGYCIDIELENGEMQHMYYDNSHIVRLLAYYPFVQIALVALFAAVAYVIFSRQKKLEQNKLWIGLARETAHQLGTPITALLGWRDLLKTDGIDSVFVSNEIGRDVERLQSIADRFSKIGSQPEMSSTPLAPELEGVINYLQTRVDKRISLALAKADDYNPAPPHNATLLGWAVENICRNAVDAMPEGGLITLRLSPVGRRGRVAIDIEDCGRGMTKSQARNIFSAGYTTKRRGWGIGLTLAKRIVEQYHRGRLTVRSTEQNVGTTMRIVI